MLIQTHDIIDTTLTLKCIATGKEATELALQVGKICMIEQVDWDAEFNLIIKLTPSNGTAIVGSK